jgi:hypothetical protein
LIVADVLGIDSAGWQAIAAIAGTPLVVGSLVLLILQSRYEVETTRASVHQSITESMLEVDKIFFENPQYRKYFYGGAEPPADPDEYERVEALAELMLDFMDNCVAQQDRLDSGMAEGWMDYVNEMLETSPIMCDLLARHEVKATDRPRERGTWGPGPDGRKA